eukprot:snap_masked-scaffold_110-processed-gene-0.4-mRNA-1 protein AED:0.06 eAED:0.06 QI:0/-1/0/1/-1/1/1/0/279
MTSKENQRASLTTDENLIVGAVGGTLETALLMPIITYKFCKQEGRPYPKFPRMYKGVGIQAGSVAPLTAIQMAINGLTEKYMLSLLNSTQLNKSQTISCAALAGAFSALLYAPVDSIMIHQQKLNLPPIQTISTLIKTYGPTSIFRALPSTALREALYVGGYLGLAPVFTKEIMNMKGWENSFYLGSLSGAILAGVISNLLSHPVDTVKTLQQADMEKKKFRNSFISGKEVWKEEGIKGFFKGGFARTVRGCGAFFVVSSLREQAIRNKTEKGSPWRFK